MNVPAYLSNPTKSSRDRAIEFFYEHAGYSYPSEAKGNESAIRKHRLENARNLAEAEAEASSLGWYIEWEYDDMPWESDDDYVPEEVLGAVLRDEDGNVLASLWGIADPDRAYKRVIEAELALESLDKRP